MPPKNGRWTLGIHHPQPVAVMQALSFVESNSACSPCIANGTWDSKPVAIKVPTSSLRLKRETSEGILPPPKLDVAPAKRGRGQAACLKREPCDDEDEDSKPSFRLIRKPQKPNKQSSCTQVDDPLKRPATGALKLKRLKRARPVPKSESPPHKRRRANPVSQRPPTPFPLDRYKEEGGCGSAESSPLSSAPSSPPAPDDHVEKSPEPSLPTPSNPPPQSLKTAPRDPPSTEKLQTILSDYIDNAYLAKLNALDIHALDFRVGRLLVALQEVLRDRRLFVKRQEELVQDMQVCVRRMEDMGCEVGEVQGELEEANAGVDGVMKEIFGHVFGPAPSYTSSRGDGDAKVKVESREEEEEGTGKLACVEGWLRMTDKSSTGDMFPVPYGDGYMDKMDRDFKPLIGIPFAVKGKRMSAFEVQERGRLVGEAATRMGPGSRNCGK